MPPIVRPRGHLPMAQTESRNGTSRTSGSTPVSRCLVTGARTGRAADLEPGVIPDNEREHADTTHAENAGTAGPARDSRAPFTSLRRRTQVVRRLRAKCQRIQRSPSGLAVVCACCRLGRSPPAPQYELADAPALRAATRPDAALAAQAPRITQPRSPRKEERPPLADEFRTVLREDRVALSGIPSAPHPAHHEHQCAVAATKSAHAIVLPRKSSAVMPPFSPTSHDQQA